jgi:hypothetical protein
MKVLILTFIIGLCSLSLSAQTDSAKSKYKVNLGFMLNPQGAIAVKNPSSGFSASIPLFVILPIEKGNVSLTPIYSLTDNSFGGFVNYSFPKCGTYLVGIKSVQTSEIYLGIGVGIPVAEKRASAFVELGALRSNWEPLFFMGLSIPFTIK